MAEGAAVAPAASGREESATDGGLLVLQCCYS